MAKTAIHVLLATALAAQTVGSTTLPRASCATGMCQCSLALEQTCCCSEAPQPTDSCCSSSSIPIERCCGQSDNQEARICRCGCNDPVPPTPATEGPTNEFQNQIAEWPAHSLEVPIVRVAKSYPSAGSFGFFSGRDVQPLFCLWLI